MAETRVPSSRPGHVKGIAGAGGERPQRLTYGRYLAIPELLGLQRPVSSSHDEMLFILIHQTTELWLRLMLHELDAARQRIARDELRPSFKMMARVARIQAQLVDAWDVLSTLTPDEYLRFRDRLGPASGFQSHQYRRLEFLFGNRDRAKLRAFEEEPEFARELAQELERPSLYDEAVRVLARRGFGIAPELLDRPLDRSWEPHGSLRRAWLEIYRRPERFWDLFELAEKLVDLEDAFRQWRFRHLTTVERIIGHRRGTGGTAGVSYLRRALDVALFPELWEVRTVLAR